MVTTKQKVAAKVVVSGGSPTDGMRKAKYAPSVIRKPQVLTDSQGFKDVLKQYGLTEELVTTALVEDIKAKPKKRFLELSLGADILNMKKRIDPSDERPTHTTNIVIITPNAN